MLTAKTRCLDVPGQLYWLVNINETEEMSSTPLHFKMVLFHGWLFSSHEWKNWFLSAFISSSLKQRDNQDLVPHVGGMESCLRKRH